MKNTKNNFQEGVVTFLTGALFSIGLMISGMLNPEKVLGFLSPLHDFDPTLIFVMAGGLLVNVVGNRFILKLEKPFWNGDFSLPTSKDIDKKLIFGSLLFGIGWGIGGICPGPALATLLFMPKYLIFFSIGLISGMLIFQMQTKKMR